MLTCTCTKEELETYGCTCDNYPIMLPCGCEKGEDQCEDCEVLYE